MPSKAKPNGLDLPKTNSVAATPNVAAMNEAVTSPDRRSGLRRIGAPSRNAMTVKAHREVKAQTKRSVIACMTL